MARRSSNKNNDNMGCMFAGVDLVMSLLLILFTSENPTARKVGWGIVIGALFLNALGREGASAEDIEVVFILGIIIIVVVCLFKAFTKPTEKNIDHKPTGNAKSYEKPLESEESVGFEESFRRIVQQERKVTGGKDQERIFAKRTKGRSSISIYINIETKSPANGCRVLSFGGRGFAETFSSKRISEDYDRVYPTDRY